MGIYNTARFFPCFPLYGLAVYIVHIYGLFFNIHGYRVEPHPFDSFDWLCIASRDRKQHCVETGAASVIKTSYLVVKKPKHTGDIVHTVDMFKTKIVSHASLI